MKRIFFNNNNASHLAWLAFWGVKSSKKKWNYNRYNTPQQVL